MSILTFLSQCLALFNLLASHFFYQFYFPCCFSNLAKTYFNRFNNPVVLSPGDELRTTCVYDSTSRDVTTRAGSGYREEMCFGFLTFYPKQAVNNGDNTCTSWKELPFCRFELGLYKNCNLKF